MYKIQTAVHAPRVITGTKICLAMLPDVLEFIKSSIQTLGKHNLFDKEMGDRNNSIGIHLGRIAFTLKKPGDRFT